MAEIRYFKSMEMQVYRCEGNALRFDFQDLPPITSLFRDISRRYPGLAFHVDDGAKTLQLVDGQEVPSEVTFGDHRPTEEIYSTF